MKKTTESKAWNILFNCAEIHFSFNESVDVRKAFEALPSEYAGWLEYLSDGDAEPDTIVAECYCESSGFIELIPAICKAVAATFPAASFNGNAYHDDRRCYEEQKYEFNYKSGLLQIAQIIAGEDCGYFCPECGCWITSPFATFGADKEVMCNDCEETIKVDDLNYVPPFVERREYRI